MCNRKTYKSLANRLFNDLRGSSLKNTVKDGIILSDKKKSSLLQKIVWFLRFLHDFYNIFY